MIGRTLSHYKILDEIGRGGMGVVYRAWDQRLERDVALKALPEGRLGDGAARKRFQREARSLSRLNHPHIATVHDFDTEDGVDFLVMEYIRGESLEERLALGPLEEREVLRLGSQLAEGLEAAHGEGVVHRDLKPGNLRLTPEGRLKILDFGLAGWLLPPNETATTESFTEAQAVRGTLPYMAPEQLRGKKADERTDIYAAGVVLYEMATGERPFSDTQGPGLIYAILEGTPRAPDKLRPELSAKLVEVIAKCLDKDPERRYPSAKELRLDLERLATPTGGEIAARANPRVPSRIALPSGGATALLVLLVGLIAMNVGGLREKFVGGAGDQIDSVAVLPLENLMGEPEQDYFVEGMHEALITELSKISALKVISRTSAMRYKDTDKAMPQIARELGVTGVIEGSVLREGDDVRITVQLIHGPSDRHVWADSYQRELRDILTLQSDVARAIAREIRITVTPAEASRLARRRSVNPAAYEAYVLGRHHWNQRSLDGFKKAVEAFRKAVELDSGYAPAYTGLADSYMLLGEQGWLLQSEARSLAESAVQKALAADETLAEAHTTLGHWKLHYEWNWREAEAAFQRAIELNPGDALAHARYGRFLGFLGRFEEALQRVQRARELDPLSPPVNAYLGQVYLYAKRYDEAGEGFRRTLAVNPNHTLIRHNLGELFLAQARFAEAIPELEKSIELSAEISGVPSSHYLAILGYAYARANQKRQAVHVQNELDRRVQEGLVSTFDLAILYTALGEKEQALGWLERGYEQRDVWFVELKAWPWFDSLQGDPRFQDLMRRMNFPE